MLELTAHHEYEPLCFLALDVMLPIELARDSSGWIQDDLGGRLMYCATAAQLYKTHRVLAPRRDVPLLMWLTHRSLRVLFQCTPGEAGILSERLAVLSRRALGCEEVQECSPAALASVLGRWVDQDEGPPGLSRPGGVADSGAPLTQWRRPWTSEPLRGLLRVPPGPARPAAPAQAQAEILTYDDDPTLLWPVRLVLSRRERTPRQLLDLLGRDAGLRGPLTVGPYSELSCHAEPGQVTLLAPVQGPTFRAQLREFRDRLGEALSCEAACALARQPSVVAACRSLRDALARLCGADEVYHPPYPGARHSPPDYERGQELRRRFVAAVALPFGEEVLERTQLGETYH